jgi:transcriptional regulator with XRE-family HTH domain
VDTISQFERGTVLPSIEALDRIARALGLRLSDLVSNEDDEHPADRRAIARARIETVLRSLPDDDLEVAAEQLAALAKRRSPSSP